MIIDYGHAQTEYTPPPPPPHPHRLMTIKGNILKLNSQAEASSPTAQPHQGDKGAAADSKMAGRGEEGKGARGIGGGNETGKGFGTESRNGNGSGSNIGSGSKTGNRSGSGIGSRFGSGIGSAGNVRSGSNIASGSSIGSGPNIGSRSNMGPGGSIIRSGSGNGMNASGRDGRDLSPNTPKPLDDSKLPEVREPSWDCFLSQFGEEGVVAAAVTVAVGVINM